MKAFECMRQPDCGLGDVSICGRTPRQKCRYLAMCGCINFNGVLVYCMFSWVQIRIGIRIGDPIPSALICFAAPDVRKSSEWEMERAPPSAAGRPCVVSVFRNSNYPRPVLLVWFLFLFLSICKIMGWVVGLWVDRHCAMISLFGRCGGSEKSRWGSLRVDLINLEALAFLLLLGSSTA